MWSLHCERRTVCCPLLLGFSWFFPWILLGVHLGGAGHGNLCHISFGRWHMVSVVVSGVIHVCTFVLIFKCNLEWVCTAIFPHSSILMLCRNIAHLPNMSILLWILFLEHLTGVPRLFIWCTSRQNHLLLGWILLGAWCASTVLVCVLPHNIHVVLFSFVCIHLLAFQTGVVHKCFF